MKGNVNSRIILHAGAYGLVLALVLALAFYDARLNPDIRDYLSAYIRADESFEIGYRYLMLAARNYLQFSFGTFWTILVTLIGTIFVISYRSVPVLLLSVPSLIAVSQVFVGTQVRFGLAVGLILLAASFILNSAPRLNYAWLLVAIAPLFHIGVLPLALILLAASVLSQLSARMAVVTYVVSAILIICVAQFATLHAADLLNYFGKPYLEGSVFLDRKSVISTVYAVIFLAVVSVLLVRLADTHALRPLLFAGAVAATVVGFSGTAMISGRYQQISWLLEGMIVGLALMEGRKQNDLILIGLGVFLFILSCSKLFGIQLKLSHLPQVLPV